MKSNLEESDTLIGFYSIWYYDINEAINEMINVIKNER